MYIILSIPYNFKLYKAVLLVFIVFKKTNKSKNQKKTTKINNPINNQYY